MRCPHCDGSVYIQRACRFTRVGSFLGYVLLFLALLALTGGGISLARIVLGGDRPDASTELERLIDAWGERLLIWGGAGLVLGLILRTTRSYRRCDACGRKV